MSTRYYAIGDIHGHLDRLLECHRLIHEDKQKTGDASAPIVHVGDLVDRGPKTRDVIEYLSTGQQNRKPWITLLGNHDRLFLRFLDAPDWNDPMLKPGYTWLHPHIGGRATLASYGVDTTENRPLEDIHREALDLVPHHHVDFLRRLEPYHQTPALLFVHAGIRPEVPLDAQTEDDLVWIRKPFQQHRGDFGRLVIHGHSMVREVTHSGNRVNIDTGAGRGDAASAIVTEGRNVWVLGAKGRRPLLEPLDFPA